MVAMLREVDELFRRVFTGLREKLGRKSNEEEIQRFIESVTIARLTFTQEELAELCNKSAERNITPDGADKTRR